MVSNGDMPWWVATSQSVNDTLNSHHSTLTSFTKEKLKSGSYLIPPSFKVNEVDNASHATSYPRKHL